MPLLVWLFFGLLFFFLIRYMLVPILQDAHRDLLLSRKDKEWGTVSKPYEGRMTDEEFEMWMYDHDAYPNKSVY